MLCNDWQTHLAGNAQYPNLYDGLHAISLILSMAVLFSDSLIKEANYRTAL